jgi:hypothetical protein
MENGTLFGLNPIQFQVSQLIGLNFNRAKEIFTMCFHNWYDHKGLVSAYAGSGRLAPGNSSGNNQCNISASKIKRENQTMPRRDHADDFLSLQGITGYAELLYSITGNDLLFRDGSLEPTTSFISAMTLVGCPADCITDRQTRSRASMTGSIFGPESDLPWAQLTHSF